VLLYNEILEIDSRNISRKSSNIRTLNNTFLNVLNHLFEPNKDDTYYNKNLWNATKAVDRFIAVNIMLEMSIGRQR
jgi:hypothetical protein